MFGLFGNSFIHSYTCMHFLLAMQLLYCREPYQLEFEMNALTNFYLWCQLAIAAYYIIVYGVSW